jgi:hypothetical protein
VTLCNLTNKVLFCLLAIKNIAVSYMLSMLCNAVKCVTEVSETGGVGSFVKALLRSRPAKGQTLHPSLSHQEKLSSQAVLTL